MNKIGNLKKKYKLSAAYFLVYLQKGTFNDCKGYRYNPILYLCIEFSRKCLNIGVPTGTTERYHRVYIMSFCRNYRNLFIYRILHNYLPAYILYYNVFFLTFNC